jgi:hypothetical protein
VTGGCPAANALQHGMPPDGVCAARRVAARHRPPRQPPSSNDPAKATAHGLNWPLQPPQGVRVAGPFPLRPWCPTHLAATGAGRLSCPRHGAAPVPGCWRHRDAGTTLPSRRRPGPAGPVRCGALPECRDAGACRRALLGASRLPHRLLAAPAPWRLIGRVAGPGATSLALLLEAGPQPAAPCRCRAGAVPVPCRCRAGAVSGPCRCQCQCQCQWVLEAGIYVVHARRSRLLETRAYTQVQAAS